MGTRLLSAHVDARTSERASELASRSCLLLREAGLDPRLYEAAELSDGVLDLILDNLDLDLGVLDLDLL